MICDETAMLLSPNEFTVSKDLSLLFVRLLKIADFDQIIFTLEININQKIKSFYLNVDSNYIENQIDLRKCFDTP